MRGFKDGIFQMRSLVFGIIAVAVIGFPIMLGSFFLEEIIAIIEI